ncbi:MAG: proline--tRNA ligase [Acidimicrobiales bacterium]
MKLSAMTLRTLREAPNDAEAVSHKLLVRGGYIKRVASGVYSYLPLGMKVLTKVSQIVREEFDASGAQEVLLPALHPRELWAQTGRINSMADVLMEVESKAGSFVLGPTHEEVMVYTVSQELSSYRDLPATLYQIQTKFRDEPRSRFGLMRTREFIMADAYSFDADQEAMKVSYTKLYDAYHRAFHRMGLPFTPVEADSGAIGGDVNHEFMSPSPIGEDFFGHCQSCGYAANIEAAVRSFVPTNPETAPGSMRVVETPGAPGITEAIAGFAEHGLSITASQMLKCLACRDRDGSILLLVVPGDREVRLTGGRSMLSDEEIASLHFLVKGYIGPMNMAEHGVRVVADLSVSESSVWSTGANRADHHVVDAVVGRDFTPDAYESLVTVQDGDLCPRCGSSMVLQRAVEIGHTFQLGLFYSESKIPTARYTDASGELQPYYMGCYGIGITRLLAVLVEHWADEKGMRWPLAVAPYHVVIVALGYSRSDEVRVAAESLYDALRARGIEALLDDRDLSPGASFADVELIGIPLIVVVGARGLREGAVEVRNRLSGEESKMPLDSVVDQVEVIVSGATRIS